MPWVTFSVFVATVVLAGVVGVLHVRERVSARVSFGGRRGEERGRETDRAFVLVFGFHRKRTKRNGGELCIGLISRRCRSSLSLSISQ